MGWGQSRQVKGREHIALDKLTFRFQPHLKILERQLYI
jgi:hypothetical protein